MTWIDDVMKWFIAPKTIKGIAGMIVIVIVLALDFAYWAGAIDTTNPGSGSDDTVSNANETYVIEKETPLDQSDTISAPGHGQQIPETYRDYPFIINENASEAIINVTMTDSISGPFRAPDLDLYVYAPDGEEVGNSATESADESVTLKEKLLERKGPGEYQATVMSYRGIQVSYHITAEVFYKVPLNDTEAESGE